MPRGRPALPLELKKLKGTANSTREKQNGDLPVLIENQSILLQEGERISVPKTLKTPYVKKFFRKLTKALVSLHTLSQIDLAQVETLCIMLEKLRELEQMFASLSVYDPRYFKTQEGLLALSKQFDSLASKYYISPAARSKLKLEELSAIKTQQEIEKKDDAISRLLADRKIAD